MTTAPTRLPVFLSIANRLLRLSAVWPVANSSVGDAASAGWPRRPQLVFEVGHALQQRVVAERVLLRLRGVAVRHHPQVLAGVHVDRRDAAHRSLEDVGDADQRIVGHRRRRRLLAARGDPVGQRLAGHLVVVALGRRREDRRRAAVHRGDEDHAGLRIRGRWAGDVRAATAARADVRRALALLVAAMRRRREQRRQQVELLARARARAS